MPSVPSPPSPDSFDEETAKLVRELRLAWFGRAKKPLQGSARGLVAFMGSVFVLAIMWWNFLTTGSLLAQGRILENFGWLMPVVVSPLPLSLAVFISVSDRAAGHLRIFLTGAVVTTLLFTMTAVPFAIMYQANS